MHTPLLFSFMPAMSRLCPTHALSTLVYFCPLLPFTASRAAAAASGPARLIAPGRPAGRWPPGSPPTSGMFAVVMPATITLWPIGAPLLGMTHSPFSPWRSAGRFARPRAAVCQFSGATAGNAYSWRRAAVSANGGSGGIPTGATGAAPAVIGGGA